MKIKHRLHNGETRYIVDGKINSKRRREQFDTKREAELFLKHQVKEPAIAAWWTSLTLGERIDIHASHNRAKEDGFSLLSAVETHSTQGRGISYLKKMTLDEAIGDLGTPKRLTKITNKRQSRGFLGAKVNAEVSYAARHTLASTLRNFRDYVGASKQVISVTSEQIEGFLNDGGIKKKSWSSITRKNYGQAIHNFFGWCIRRKVVKENPVISLEKINVDPFDPAILTVKECKQLLKFCWKQHSEILPLLALNLFCGIRPSECRRLRNKDIRFEDNEVVLPAKSTKTKRRRVASISDNARAWLNLVPFKLPITNVNHKWDDFLSDAKIQLEYYDKWPHDCLRHSYCSYGLRHYENAAKISLEAGHTEAVMHQHYIQMVSKTEAAKFWNIFPEELAA